MAGTWWCSSGYAAPDGLGRRESDLRIVVLIADALRKDHLACYGNQWLECANLTRLADRAVTFTRARCDRPDCRAVRLEWMTGIDTAGVDHPVSVARGISPACTMPGLLKQAGYRTGLVTDHRTAMSVYRTLCDFDFVLYCPGQADDPQLRSPDDLAGPSRDRRQPLVPELAPDRDRLQRYVRNQSGAGRTGHTTEALFARAAECLDRLGENENVFLLIDSFALLAPWDPPRTVRTYRGDNGLDKLAWLARPLASTETVTDQQLKFLRCAYADACLFYDHAMAPLVDLLARSDATYFFLASDHGVLIGDDGYIGWDATRRSPAVTDEVLLVLKPDSGPGRCDDPIRPADMYITVLALAGVEPPFKSAGRKIGAIVD